MIKQISKILAAVEAKREEDSKKKMSGKCPSMRVTYSFAGILQRAIDKVPNG